MTLRVAVTGATGYIGGRLVPNLIDAGHQVTCLVRTPQKLDTVPWRADVNVQQADVLDIESLNGALQQIDVVYHLVHAMGHDADFVDAERRGAGNVRDAAAHNGLQRIIYLGGLGDEGDNRLSRHLRSRHDVGRVLSEGSVPVTELRAAVVIGSGSASFEMLRSLVEVLPVMVVPSWVTKTKCQPVGVRDVLYYLVQVLEVPETIGRVVDIGGPDVLTYKQMMDRYAVIAGLRKRVMIPVPVFSPRLSSQWINLMTPLPIGLARPLVASLVNDVVVRPDNDIRELIPHDPLPFDESIRLAVQRVQDREVETSWTDAYQAPQPAAPRPEDPDWAGGALLTNVQVVETSATPAEVFAKVASIGGNTGWYAYSFLWRIRGLLDKLIGGVGMRRGRRHPSSLRVGDALDFFRVEAVTTNEHLLLQAEMKVPGKAWLEWRIIPNPSGGCTLRQEAMFYPRGLFGRAYWWVLLPFHKPIFRKLSTHLALRSA